MSKIYQKLLAFGMSGTLIFATSAPVFAEGETDKAAAEQSVNETEDGAAYEKYESVYARLSADGTASDAYVVNHFSVDQSTPIVDYGNYTTLKNLTNLDNLTEENGKVAIDPEQGEFYYQGTLENAQLPWLFKISYKLDGKTISAEELSGKSGKLEIHFTATKNPNADASFYDNYVNQISLTLDSEKAKNIQASGATAADAGASRQLTFTMLPGTDGDYTITADVTNFSMSGFSIAAVPYSMEIDTDQFSMDDFTGQLDELTDAVDQLSTGTADLANGVGDLQNGSYSLLDGSAKIQDGLKEISGNSGTIVNASAKIRDALNTVSNELGSADFSGLTSLKQLPAGLNQLAAALDQIQGGLSQLYSGYAQSYQALDTYMEQAKASMPSASDLETLAKAAGTYDALKAAHGGSGSGNSGSDAAGDETEQQDLSAMPVGEAMKAYTNVLNSYKSMMTLLTVYYGDAGHDVQGVNLAFQSVLAVLNPDTASSTADSSLSIAIGTVSENIKQIAGSMDQLTETDIEGQMNELKNGLRQLADSYGEFHNGLVSYTDGVNTLSGSYGSYQDGLKSFVNGVGDLHNGANELSDGMGEFADGISDMPNQIQSTIDDMMEQYNGSDYDAVSFVDSRNENVASVQFVISTDGVEEPATEVVETTETQKGFFDRLKALFIKD